VTTARTNRADKADPEQLLRELEEARGHFGAAERRARTYLADRGLLDQTSRGLTVLLREASRASSKT
jgi:hypothetical protein